MYDRARRGILATVVGAIAFTGVSAHQSIRNKFDISFGQHANAEMTPLGNGFYRDVYGNTHQEFNGNLRQENGNISVPLTNMGNSTVYRDSQTGQSTFVPNQQINQENNSQNGNTQYNQPLLTYDDLIQKSIETKDSNRPDSYDYAKKASMIRPAEGEPYRMMGRARYYQGKYEEALYNWKKATELNKNDVKSWENIAYIQINIFHNRKETYDALIEGKRLGSPSAINDLNNFEIITRDYDLK